MSISCCKNCVAPKRHSGCHSNCEDYKKAKEDNEKKKKWEKEHRPVPLSNYDFDKIRCTAPGRVRSKGISRKRY